MKQNSPNEVEDLIEDRVYHTHLAGSENLMNASSDAKKAAALLNDSKNVLESQHASQEVDYDVLTKVLSDLQGKNVNYKLAIDLFEQIPFNDSDSNGQQMINVLKERLLLIKQLDLEEKELQNKQYQLSKQLEKRSFIQQSRSPSSKKAKVTLKTSSSLKRSQLIENNFVNNQSVKDFPVKTQLSVQLQKALSNDNLKRKVSLPKYDVKDSLLNRSEKQLNSNQRESVRNEGIPDLNNVLRKMSRATSNHTTSGNGRQEIQCTFHPSINKKSEKLSKRNQLDSKYSVRYLYQDFLIRQEKSKETQAKELHNQKEVIEKSKMNSKSQKIIQQKINKILSFIVNGIQEGNYISYEKLGILYVEIGLFKAFLFDKDQDQTSLYLQERKKADPQRLEAEMKFHQQSYRILSFGSENEGIDKKLLFDSLMVLFEKKIPLSYAENILKELMINHFEIEENLSAQEKMEILQKFLYDSNGASSQQQGDGINAENWDINKLILAFRKLHEDKTSLMEWYTVKNNNFLSEVNLEGKQSYKDNNNGSGIDNHFKFHPTINKKSRQMNQIMQFQSSPSRESNNQYSSNEQPSYNNHNTIQNTNNQNYSSNFNMAQGKNRFDQLYEYSKVLQQKRKEQKEFTEIQIKSNCPFKPAVNQKKQFNTDENSQNQNVGNRLYSLHTEKISVMHESRIQFGAEKEKKELKECTFRPAINYTYTSTNIGDGNEVFNIKGVIQQNERLQKARLIQAEKDSFYERQRNSLSQNHSRFTETQPFSFDNNNNVSNRLNTLKREREIIGNVDVNFSKGKKGRIIICKGDSAEELSLNFAKIYSLNDEMRITLKDMLSDYIKKIIEQGNQENKLTEQQEAINENNSGEDHINNKNETATVQLNNDSKGSYYAYYENSKGNIANENEDDELKEFNQNENFVRSKEYKSQLNSQQQQTYQHNVDSQNQEEEEEEEDNECEGEDQDSNKSIKGEEGEEGNRISSIDSVEAAEMENVPEEEEDEGYEQNE